MKNNADKDLENYPDKILVNMIKAGVYPRVSLNIDKNIKQIVKDLNKIKNIQQRKEIMTSVVDYLASYTKMDCNSVVGTLYIIATKIAASGISYARKLSNLKRRDAL